MSRRVLLTVGLVGILTASGLMEPLWAQQTPRKSDETMHGYLQETSRNFGKRSGSDGTWFFVVAFLFSAAAVIGIVYFDTYIRRRPQAALDNPHYLFIELVRAHELTRTERQFLKDLADRSHLEDPLPLFIEPQYFLSALEDERFRKSLPMIEYLLKKLFDIEREDQRAARTLPGKTYSGATTIIRPFRERNEL